MKVTSNLVVENKREKKEEGLVFFAKTGNKRGFSFFDNVDFIEIFSGVVFTASIGGKGLMRY